MRARHRPRFSCSWSLSRGPGAYGHVGEGRMQRDLEPGPVERIARRRTARFDGLLHLGLDGLGDPVQEGQGIDDAPADRCSHVLPPFREGTSQTYTRIRTMPFVPRAVLATWACRFRAKAPGAAASRRTGGRASA